MEIMNLEEAMEGKAVNRAYILDHAGQCVNGDREGDYGSPENSFRAIGELWETYISTSKHTDLIIEPRDVAAMMALMKIARIASGKKTDNWIDLAGYAACGGELDQD